MVERLNWGNGARKHGGHGVREGQGVHTTITAMSARPALSHTQVLDQGGRSPVVMAVDAWRGDILETLASGPALTGEHVWLRTI